MGSAVLSYQWSKLGKDARQTDSSVCAWGREEGGRGEIGDTSVKLSLLLYCHWL